MLYDAGSSNPMLCDNLEGGMGWEEGGKFKAGTCVYQWLIHVDVCRNQYSIVKQLSSN